jgi:hypothetical protein
MLLITDETMLSLRGRALECMGHMAIAVEADAFQVRTSYHNSDSPISVTRHFLNLLLHSVCYCIYMIAASYYAC